MEIQDCMPAVAEINRLSNLPYELLLTAPSEGENLLEYDTQQYDLLGIRVGMVRFQAEAVFRSYGYEQVSEDCFRKGSLCIILEGEWFLERICVKLMEKPFLL